MKSQLPSLGALRAFEAAARHLSFTRAASDLNVTPAAVSQLVRQLEEQVGNKLFSRTTRSLQLTERGRAAWPHLQDAFDHLHAGARELRSAAGPDMITISVTPSFGSCWLMPRLMEFRAKHPGIAVRLDARDELCDFKRDDVDIAIRQGRGQYAGLKSELLMSDEALVVCSPGSLKERDVRSPLRLLKQRPLLHVDWQMAADAAPTWAKWAAYHGIEGVPLAGGLRFSIEDLAVRAAISGLGIALITKVFVADDLATGRLVCPLPATYKMPTAFHHYLVYPAPSQEKRKRVSLFRNWLMQQAQMYGGRSE
jgi:LysR family glycine cleavage system transcriptional activator